MAEKKKVVSQDQSEKLRQKRWKKRFRGDKGEGSKKQQVTQNTRGNLGHR